MPPDHVPLEDILNELDKPKYAWVWKHFEWCSSNDKWCLDGGWDLEEWGIKLDIKAGVRDKHLRASLRILPFYVHLNWWGDLDEE